MMIFMRRVVVSIASVVLVAGSLACGSDTNPTNNNNNNSNSLCAGDERADTYVAGLERMTEQTGYRVTLAENLYEGSPRAPDRGLNTWRIKVTDNAGQPMTDVKVILRPWMPDHGHGTTPLDIEATATGDTYEAGPFNLFMGGFWRFTVKVEEGTEAEEAVFGFCIEG